MPIHKTNGGWQWGTHGKVYKTKAGAQRQMRAIFASQNNKKQRWQKFGKTLKDVIRKCCGKVKYYHKAGGYEWKYKDE